ncbi:hypothetical protein CSA56_09405 [candidate division KSB3 bacterium]|uniref:Uncharacterized protein n=1 Tax=candidate division KSB3 bacterium TaxID=2044937 RepID=A0A2G6KE35_9BACT|nr:MAG: hypothetical protein CSA56_09405 [candidate division KSB3 bacterium]
MTYDEDIEWGHMENTASDVSGTVSGEVIMNDISNVISVIGESVYNIEIVVDSLKEAGFETAVARNGSMGSNGRRRKTWISNSEEQSGGHNLLSRMKSNCAKCSFI